MIYILTLLISTAYGATYYPVGKAGAKTSYTKHKKCESQESFTCWDIAGKDLRYYEPGTIDVDDFEKPLYEAESAITACADEAECKTLLEGPFTLSYCQDNGQTENHYPIIAADFSRVYCTMVTGFEQMTVPALVINQPLKDAADADDAAKIADRNARETKRGTRQTLMIQCAREPDLTNAQLKACVVLMLKEFVKDKLEEREL